MPRYSINKRRPRFLATTAAAMLAAVQWAAAAPSLDDVVAGVNIDPAQISVSGISSGGFMAHQFHVAHSEYIMGVGVVAGGPYYCSAGSILDAVTKCSQFVMLECRQLGLDAKLCGKTDRAPKNRQEARRVAAASFAEAKTQEAAGRISKLAGLKGDRVYLISAEHDAIVPHGVMDAVFHFYADADKAAIEAGHIDYNRSFPARHTMIRDAFNKPAGDVVGNCAQPPTLPPPVDRDAFIDDCEAVARQRQARDQCICPPAAAAGAAAVCPPAGKRAICKDLQDVDLAGAILRRIYGAEALKGGRVAVSESEVKAFDQRSVFSKFSDIPYSELQNASMAREGYVFIPKPCTDGRKCRLHVAFHGCRQGGLTDRRSGQSGNLFAKFAGYNEWAQANDIVVVYPQAQVRNGTLASPPVNPRGCWDWWGQYYTHTGYHTQAGKQIRAVAQMINTLAGGRELLPVTNGQPLSGQ
ncbi:hypothetical protein [Accumulibacter sp.]|uniref:hypothetical protein n=1 Tax=Accumulibacter sp. TaxID=2053492 RepID=UPI001AC9871C|nr:hypothetical protein [Accumulibacter sp.]MBN8453317.1 hypothetical protein [Accumulibacter sp.]